MSEPACPSDDELLALATGEPAAGAVAEHLKTCPACGRRVKTLLEEVANLRAFATPRNQPPPAEPKG
jgi:anti-sigma factor RsiW